MIVHCVNVFKAFFLVSNCFNSKTLFKDGDPVSLQFIFPGAILFIIT